MNRSEYLDVTKGRFFNAFSNEKVFDAHSCRPGIFRVFKYKIIESHHPHLVECDKVIIGTANWKAEENEEFLEELEFKVDVTPLLIGLNDSGVFNMDKFNEINLDFDSKIQTLVALFKRYNVYINSIEDKIPKWAGVQKTKSVVIIDNRNTQDNVVIYNSKLLPLPHEDNEVDNRNVVCVLKGGANTETINMLFPGCEIIETESDNLADALTNEWLNVNYGFLLNDLRNQLQIQMANSVLVPGYYDVHTLSLVDARRDWNGQPLGFDYPCQFIGIAHWMPLEGNGEDDFFEFNRNHSMEVRLNPLFNSNAIINGLTPNFPREKSVNSFFSVAKSAYIKVNSIDFDQDSSSYRIDWEAIIPNEKVEEED